MRWYAMPNCFLSRMKRSRGHHRVQKRRRVLARVHHLRYNVDVPKVYLSPNIPASHATCEGHTVRSWTTARTQRHRGTSTTYRARTDKATTKNGGTRFFFATKQRARTRQRYQHTVSLPHAHGNCAGAPYSHPAHDTASARERERCVGNPQPFPQKWPTPFLFRQVLLMIVSLFCSRPCGSCGNRSGEGGAVPAPGRGG